MKMCQKIACFVLSVLLLGSSAGCSEADDRMPFETSTEQTEATISITEISSATESAATTESSKPTILTYGEAITVIDSIPYAAYTETFTENDGDNEVPVGDLILQRTEYEITENEDIAAEYYLSTELIEQYYADDLTWDGEVCRFQKNHLTVTIADGKLTAEDPIFGKQPEQDCRTFVYNNALYINHNDVYDLLGLTAAWEVKRYESSLIVCHFLIYPLPNMECRISENDGAITKVYTYEGAEPVETLSAEPFMISETGIYYYESDGVYYADFDGTFYPLKMTDYESRDVPQ